MKSYVWVALLALLVVACRSQWTALYEVGKVSTVYSVQPSPTKEKGDPAAGYQYVTTGNYIGSGFPWSFANPDTTQAVDSVLHRDGRNAFVTYERIAFQAPNEAWVISGNCFSCHASERSGQVNLALGDTYSDFTGVKPWQSRFFPKIVKKNSTAAEWEASQEFVRWLAHSFPWIKTDQVGLNPAFRLEEAFAAHRDPLTLAYQPKEVFPRQGPNVASDVPPLWNVKKKQTLYYNGMGRGDFTKLLMQAGLMGISDTSAAREIQRKFVDVLAWLETLEPPRYPSSIDPALAARGKEIFVNHCQKCHGSYHENPAFEQYPNKVIPLNEIKTDPAYALYFVKQSGLPDWFNQSWLGQSAPQAQLLPSEGYVAPPLDGVWATAPYLHNGSVPTLDDLLFSPKRPAFWTREAQPAGYDYDKVGQRYRRDTKVRSSLTYDTTKPGQSNRGHEFGDKLGEEERRSVIEYLKTL